jgi:threonine dehydrogenase-like Zn-dependent dehydrogenase
MKAVVLDRTGLACREVPPPVARAGEVLIDVAYAGVCRTDLFVAEGRIPCELPRVLGHELSGRVVGTGEAVSVDPRIAAGFLGIDCDGAFAERVCVPEACLVRLPTGLSLAEGAYVEPVAATLAITRSGIRREERGFVWGQGRIAELALAVLAALGFERIERFDHESPPESDHFDFAIETGLDTAAVEHIVGALRSGGKLVLKSRTLTAVGFPLAALVKKEIEIRAVAYGSFEQAVELIHARRLDVRSLLGAKRPLTDAEQVFAEARRGEQKKLLFEIGGD